MSGPVLAACDLRRTYRTAAGDVHAVDGVTLEVPPGRLVVVRGRSGSGKTTLLNLLGGLDRPDAGRVLLGDRDLTAMDDAELVEVRRREVGYVFQSFGLLPVLSAAENVSVPLRLLRTDPAERDRRVAELLDLVGLAAHAAQRPAELSGGQQQRVAVARALAGEPRLLIADEPTGQLDSGTARQVLGLLRELVDQRGVSVVVATHDPALVDLADDALELTDGRLAADPRVEGSR